MKLYEAVKIVVNILGKTAMTNVNVVHALNDYNAFEESKSFKIIVKNLITEGYMIQLIHALEWEKSHYGIIQRFTATTGFELAQVVYVIQSLGYAFGYTCDIPQYVSDCGSAQIVSTSTSTPASAPVSSQSNIVIQKVPNSVVTVNGIPLDKTEKQYSKLKGALQRAYKEAAEAYLEGIIEFKSDFEKDLGVKVQTSACCDEYGVSLSFEISGKIKIKYDYYISFNVLLYDASNRIIAQEDVSVGSGRKSFEVCEAVFSYSKFYKLGNIHRIVVYWDD